MTSEESKEKAEEAKEDAGPQIGPVAGLFTKALPGVAIEAVQGALDVLLTVDRKDVHKVLEAARNDETLAFDFLRDLCGVDYEADGLEVVYHLYSYRHGHNVTVKAKVPTGDPKIATASDLWLAADWHEREARDMFGIVFEGHPNLVPILLPEDMLDHFPLRKDNPLAPLEEWQGEMLGANMGSAGHIPPGSGFEVEASTEAE
ncbi:MAG TPA: NADH-quinone oxidoreductase subunit C [Dehalococcoidia bacterium]|jgi:NADH-quinone oxidoreductase subunit C|nr:NADH-quinone oxidoreductase subunit C [Dehalococcoidia bacterium]